jgi:hypothetical protein
MPDTITLGTVSGLSGDMQWIDEFTGGSDLVGQVETATITGALIVQASAQQAGRRITLQGRMDGDKGFGILTRAQIEALREIAAVPGAVYELTMPDGREFNVMFRRENPAVEAEPLKHIWPAEDADKYTCTINLIQV